VATPASAAPRLVRGFGEGGIARVPLMKWEGFRELGGALRPARQADGKLLVGAQLFGDRDAEEFILARFRRGGALDKTFGRRGRVRIDFRWQFVPSKVLARRDGRIQLVGTVGGWAYFASRPSQLGIVTLLPDGSRDRSFGTNGFVAWNPPWRAGAEWMDVFPGLVVPQRDGRLLVAANVDERTWGVSSDLSWRRLVFVRFDRDGSLDESFGRFGTAELDWDGGYIHRWARLADGRIATVASRHEGAGATTAGSTAWWLHSFAGGGSAAGGLVSAGSMHLGLDVLDTLTDLVPTRDGGLLMIGDADIQHERGPAAAVRRILPDGSLDRRYGRRCGQRALRARSRGGAATRHGGVLVSATRLMFHARPRRFDSWVVPRDGSGCVAARPLRLRGLVIGPPLLQRRRSALLSATYDKGVALIKIRR